MKDSNNINKGLKEDKNNNIPNSNHPRLLNLVQDRIRAKHYSIRTVFNRGRCSVIWFTMP